MFKVRGRFENFCRRLLRRDEAHFIVVEDWYQVDVDDFERSGYLIAPDFGQYSTVGTYYRNEGADLIDEVTRIIEAYKLCTGAYKVFFYDKDEFEGKPIMIYNSKKDKRRKESA